MGLSISDAGQLADPIVSGNREETREDDSDAVARCDDVHSEFFSCWGNLATHSVISVDVGKATLKSLDKNENEDD